MVAISLQSSAGRLVGRHDVPEGPAPASGPRAAVVCHPHPVQGGTLDNKVVVKLAQGLRRRGLHVVRFNFRGAGGSQGEYDHGRGEQDDVRTALDQAAALAPGSSLLVAGFSFGSWVGLTTAAGDPRVTARLAVAPPVNHYDFTAIAADPTPLAVIYAEQDELVPAEQVRAWVAGRSPAPRAYPVAGAGHLFHAHLGELSAALDSWLDELTCADPGPSVHSAP